MTIEQVSNCTPTQIEALESGRSKINFKRKYGGKK